MIDVNKNEFKQIIVNLGKAYSKDIERELLGIYWKALNDLEVDDIRRAADCHIQASKYFPKPAELREYIVGKNGGKGQQSIEWLMVNVKF